MVARARITGRRYEGKRAERKKRDQDEWMNDQLEGMIKKYSDRRRRAVLESIVLDSLLVAFSSLFSSPQLVLFVCVFVFLTFSVYSHGLTFFSISPIDP